MIHLREKIFWKQYNFPIRFRYVYLLFCGISKYKAVPNRALSRIGNLCYALFTFLVLTARAHTSTYILDK